MSADPAPCSDPVEPGAFEVADDGKRWVFRGGLTLDDAARVLDAAGALPLPKSGRVDMSGLGSADSAALAVLMALKRRASAERHRIAFEGLPATLAALAHVYGIDELIGAPAP
jgi:phospholipid transport system transporter-binding protein